MSNKALSILKNKYDNIHLEYSSSAEKQLENKMISLALLILPLLCEVIWTINV